jgi:hypothetical protein
MDIFSTFATDATLEEKGVWKKMGNGRFLIARANTRAYNAEFTKLYEQHDAALNANDEEANKLAEEIMAQVYAKTVLLGWDGANKFKGEDLGEYSYERALELLRLKEFRTWVAKIATSFDNYKAVQEQAAGKP